MTELEKANYEQYWKHASTLRGWFIAYGIGTIVVILSNKPVLECFEPGKLKSMAMWFLAGVIFQVVLAFINKIYNYHLFLKTINKPKAESENAGPDISFGPFWIDIVLDSLTIFAFAIATTKFIGAFYAAP